MMEAVSSFCRGKGIDMRDIRFVGLDGCNTMSGEHKEFLRLKGSLMVNTLINENEDAFVKHTCVLSAFSVLDPMNLPADVSELPEYGIAHLETLAQFYGTEQIDEFEGNRTVAPPELGCSVTVRNELEAKISSHSCLCTSQ
ncbi:hypothetical protein ACF0H5_003332 [Mactra antiquata]